MPGTVNNTGAGQIPVTGNNSPSGKASSADADEFSRQIEEDSASESEQAQKDELLELMKKQSFNDFSKQEKERLEEIRKDME